MNSKTAFIFPAFITDFTGKELDFLNRYSVDVNSYLQRISNFLDIDLPVFDYESRDYRMNELNSQILAYSFSCAIYDVLEKKKIAIDFIAGYSMGIYASLYAAKSISFEEGAKFIYTAFNIISDLAKTKIYGMGAVIGLSAKDIENIIKENAPEVEIMNVNNEHSLVVAGKKADIRLVLEKAKEEGAMSTVELIVNTPYHSKYLLKYSDEIIKKIDNINLQDAVTPIISTFDQREIVKLADIKNELLYNLTRNINWYQTMIRLLDKGVTEFYECGAGKDLKKISRFINGDYKMNSIYKI